MAIPTLYIKQENVSCITESDQNIQNDCQESISVLFQVENQYVTTSQEATVKSAICRLCSESDFDADNMMNIFDEKNIYEQINICLPIRVLPDDALPKNVCSECVECLDKHFKFHQAVMESDNCLKQMFDGFLQSDIPMIQIIPHEEYEAQGIHKSAVSNSIHNDHLYAEISIENNENIEAVDVITDGDVSAALSNEICTMSMSPDQNVVVETLESINESLIYIEENQSDVEIINIINSENSQYEDNGSEVIDNSTPMYMCNVCNGIAPDLVSLFSHSVVAHLTSEEKYPCVLCDSLIFTSEDELFNHMNLHQYSQNESPNGDTAESAILGTKNLDFGFGEVLEMSLDKDKMKEPIIGETTTPRSYFSCTVCDKKFKLKSRVDFHMQFHRGIEPGYCTMCDKKFVNENLLYRHIWYLHNGGAEKRLSKNNSKKARNKAVSGENCVKCDMFFTHKFSRLVHEERKHGITRQCYSCFYCMEAFATPEQVTEHMGSEHPNIRTNDVNMKSTIINRLYQCEYCFRLFTKSSAVHTHRTLEHSRNPMFSCRHCSEEYSTHEDLLCHIAWTSQHYVSHNKQDYPPRPVARKVFHCHLCSKMFQSLAPMVNHMAIHNESDNLLDTSEQARQHTCSYCLKTFTQEAALIKHTRIHTGERPFVCAICGKSFNQSSGLATHSKVHTDERPYTCDHCPRTFKIKGDRDVHQRKHSGDRPFKCSTCQKTFMTQQVYSQHCKIHTNHRPYVCKICKASFRRSHVLTVHALRHSGEKPHCCELCDKRYRQRSDLLKHMKVQHGVTSAMMNNKKLTD